MKTIALITSKLAEDAAKKLAKKLRGGEVLALIGPLGSGKTTFTKALAKQLKTKDKTSSPTFVMMNYYRVRLNKLPMRLLHLDVYRAKSLREVRALGITEMWQQPDTITIIEWADKIKKLLPKKSVIIRFRHDKQP